MIVKKQEKNGKIKAMYSSSTICASIFDTTTNDLIVIFNNGGQYKYPSVSLTDYTRFEIADSNGTTFNTYIKKKYTNFEKLDKLSDEVLKSILDEVSEITAAEEKNILIAKSKAIIEAMHTVIGEYIKTGSLEKTSLETIKTKIEDYTKVVEPKEEEAQA
jgi:hypothetical protein